MRIAFCGSHGTGKTTLTQICQEQYNLHPLTQTLRNFWKEQGVTNFSTLPPEVRGEFQKYLLLHQLSCEDQVWHQGLVTERSVLDFLAYTKVSSNMSDIDLSLYERLVRDRLQSYTRVFYLPIEFDMQPENLRAPEDIRQEVDDCIVSYLDQWLPKSYVTLRGSVEERMDLIKSHLS